jgi:hypothetical protein
MKGVSVNSIRSFVSALLDKVDLLLTSEPARLIGYGAAVIVYLVARVLADRGYLDVQLSFDQSIGAAFGAIATLVILVESIRRFVYAPTTYIEDLSDESEAAHELAHMEEDLARWKAAAQAAQAEQSKPKTSRTVVVGSAKADGSGELSN